MHNRGAERLLDAAGEVGTAATDPDIPSWLRDLLLTRSHADNLIALTDDRVLVADHRAVSRGDVALGGVLVLRDGLIWRR